MLLLQKHMARTNTPHILLLLTTITSTHHTTRFLLCAVLSCYLLLYKYTCELCIYLSLLLHARANTHTHTDIHTHIQDVTEMSVQTLG